MWHILHVFESDIYRTQQDAILGVILNPQSQHRKCNKHGTMYCGIQCQLQNLSGSHLSTYVGTLIPHNKHRDSGEWPSNIEHHVNYRRV